VFARLNYREVIEAEAERRMAAGEVALETQELARRSPVYRRSGYKWAVIEAVMRDFNLDPRAYRRALVANAPALSRKAEELDRCGRERLERGDREGALRYMRKALELEHTESREGMADVLAALVRHENQLMLAEVPSLAHVMRGSMADES
jgi:tetratricopeptide (TPR) repeat protein